MINSHMDEGTPPRLTPDDIRHASIPYTEHGGYDAPAVAHVLATAADQLTAAQAEILKLRAEAERNRPGATMDASAETVNLLRLSQVIADKHISDAEEHAPDLIETAPKQYTDILQKAQDSVSGPAAPGRTAAVGAAGGSDQEYTTPIQEIEYVRTYTKVAQVQLRAVIDALAKQVDQLGQLPIFGAAPPPAVQTGDTDHQGA